MSQPFAFTPENEARARRIVDHYPAGRQASAVMALLDLAQRQNDNLLTIEAVEHVAGFLDMPRIRVMEVATFYTMYNLAPAGRTQVNVCTTTPCWLRGSDDIVAACREVLGIDIGEVTADGAFGLGEVECLGACVNAPVLQVGDDYYEDLDGARAREILQALLRGEKPACGSQTGRQASCPAGGPTTLTEMAAEKA